MGRVVLGGLHIKHGLSNKMNFPFQVAVLTFTTFFCLFYLYIRFNRVSWYLFHKSMYSPISIIKLHGLSPQANYTDRLSDRRLSEKLVSTLADRGCRVVSATVPPQSLISVF
jgi:hypothetical protein